VSFWDEPKLLQYAQIIVALPILHYLAVLKAVHADAFKLKWPSSRRAKLLRLSLVCTSKGVAAYHLLTLGYHIFNSDVEGWEGFEVQGEKLLHLLDALDVLIRLVPDSIGRVGLGKKVEVPSDYDLLPTTPHQSLVLFGRHAHLLLPSLSPSGLPLSILGHDAT
jgi:hypothetical protein